MGFDINRFCKYYLALKIAMIKTYDIHNFEILINEITCGSNKMDFTKRVLNDVRKYLTKEEWIFWNTYLSIMEKKTFEIFTSDGALLYNNDYLDIDTETYKPLQKRLFDCNIKYIDCGIDKLKYLNEQFDIIYLSNILGLINKPEFNCNFINELSKILNKNGIIYDYNFEKMDWHNSNILDCKYIDDKVIGYKIEVTEHESFVYSNAKLYKYIKL